MLASAWMLLEISACKRQVRREYKQMMVLATSTRIASLLGDFPGTWEVYKHKKKVIKKHIKYGTNFKNLIGVYV